MHNIDLRTGYLPADPPMEYLPPNFTFSIWNEMCDELPNLLRQGRVRETLAKLPLVAPQEFDILTQNKCLAECAARKVFFLGSAFVHPYLDEDGRWERTKQEGEGAVVIKTIPAPLATAMYFFSQYLHRKPILSYVSYCLNNWRIRNKYGELTLENSEIIDGFLKTADENWFIKIHWVIEKEAVPALEAARNTVRALQEKDTATIEQNLFVITQTLDKMLKILLRMPEGCSTEYYWNQVRPFIFFFDNVIYEGVESLNSQPQKFFGETGAQSSLVPTFDTVLGIEHRPSPLIGHILTMRDYMPVEHRAFLDWLGSKPSLRAFIIKSRSRILVLRYNECLRALHAFRSQHLQWAKEYIAQKDKNPYGTGGTKFLPFLEQMNDETLDHMLPIAVH